MTHHWLHSGCQKRVMLPKWYLSLKLPACCLWLQGDIIGVGMRILGEGQYFPCRIKSHDMVLQSLSVTL